MKCRICGCTDDDCSNCVALTGVPCSWAYAGVCLACNDAAKGHRNHTPEGRLTRHGSAFARGYRVAAAGKKRRSGYDTWSMQGRGYDRAWCDGYDLYLKLHSDRRTEARP